jgi:anaerobic magnesium-protoporphyrin IX monomethyl ester cyclase
MKKFKVLLINPPHIQKLGLYPKLVFQPIGLGYIASVLEKEGYRVSILDALGLSWKNVWKLNEKKQLTGLNYDQIKKQIKSISPDIVGIGAPFTLQAKSSYLVADLVKSIDKKIITVMGGPHVTSFPHECLEKASIDFVVIGEGELSFLELTNRLLEGQKKFQNILGIGFKNDNKIFINAPRAPIKDLDKIPFPARHLLPMEEYFKAAKAMRTGRKEIYWKRGVALFSSRGCPFKCTFCISHLLWTRIWRARTPENVVSEIEELVRKYKVNHIHFEDDNLTMSKERIDRICDLIFERNLKITWDTPNGIRADTINEETLIKMKKSGCKEICVAPESGNQYVVNEVIKKRVDLKKIEDVVKICKKIGIRVEAFFVIGSVGETKTQIRDTIEYARKLRKLGCKRCHFHIATPFKGTELYEQATEKGCLVNKNSCIKLETPRIETSEFTCEDIDALLGEGSMLNPAIPMDKLGLAIRLLLTNPRRFAKAALNYLVRKQAHLSEE